MRLSRNILSVVIQTVVIACLPTLLPADSKYDLLDARHPSSTKTERSSAPLSALPRLDLSDETLIAEARRHLFNELPNSKYGNTKALNFAVSGSGLALVRLAEIENAGVRQVTLRPVFNDIPYFDNDLIVRFVVNERSGAYNPTRVYKSFKGRHSLAAVGVPAANEPRRSVEAGLSRLAADLGFGRTISLSVVAVADDPQAAILLADDAGPRLALSAGL